MNNEGFLLFDSMLSLLIFTVIIITLPGLMYLTNIDKMSEHHLETYRELYVLTNKYKETQQDEYITAASIIFKEAGIPCEERLKQICK